MCSLGIEPTTFCAVNAMLYRWATGTLLHKSRFADFVRFFDYFEDLYTLAKLQIVVKCNYTAELQWRYWKSTTLVSYQHRSELPLPVTSPVPSDQMLPLRSGWSPVRLLLQETRALLLELSEREQTAWSEQTEHDSHWPWNMTTWDLDDVNVWNEHSSGLVY